MSLVLLESVGHVRVITLNAPERLNALDWELLDEFRAAVEAVATDEEARVLVVKGEGRAFCAGANLENLFGDRTRPVEVLQEVLKSVYASFLGIVDLKIPTIAAVQGAAVGAGLNIALACDVIVVGPKASLAPTFSSIGLHPGGGCTWLLNRRIGPANTKHALFAGDALDAERSVQLQIAQELAEDPAGRALELAQQWEKKSPAVMSSIKESVAVAVAGSLDESVDFESLAQAHSLQSAEFEAFVEKFLKKS